jgi:hypothetical protein
MENIDLCNRLHTAFFPDLLKQDNLLTMKTILGEVV